MGDTFYCDNYEEITGRERDGSMPVDGDGKIVTKVVTPAEEPAPAKSSAKADTKAAEPAADAESK